MRYYQSHFDGKFPTYASVNTEEISQGEDKAKRKIYTESVKDIYGNDIAFGSAKSKKLEPCKSLILLSFLVLGSKVPRFQRFLTGGNHKNAERKSGTTRCKKDNVAQKKNRQKANRSFFAGTLEPSRSEEHTSELQSH